MQKSPRNPKPQKIKKIRAFCGITEYRLENGLRVLFKADKTVPVAAVCVTYHVGSRNEAPGHTGATHILEHLMFKDSKNFNEKNKKGIKDYLEWFGALMNATTWLDRTNYFELMPKEKLEEALAVEADRMRGSLFNDNDLASEMTVVRNEYEQSRNNPFEILSEEVMQTAFTVHPYRIPTIGLKEDIEGSTATKLREFYDRFYWPNNATLAVFGDASWSETEKLILKYFAKIPASPAPIPEMMIIEPGQERPRTCKIKKQAGVSIAMLAYKAPAALDPDFPAVYMLGTILAGGFSSRMQQEIVDKGYAAEISIMNAPLRDPELLAFTATAAEAKPEKLISLMRAQCRKIMEKGVGTEEVARARERILSQLSEERDGVFNEIRAVSESIAAGDWTFGYRLEKTVQKISRADINRIAQKYLTPAGETSGILNDTI